jgi:hypothetical protein
MMSVKLDQAIRESGTRFKVFAQPRFLQSFADPETIVVTTPPGGIQAGPGDARIFVLDAIGKRPYANGETPPYDGPRHPPVPAHEGHFDHLVAGTREFSCAHMYAVVRRTLDIWEDYLGRLIPWHFETDFARLMLIPLIQWGNAQSGYGFIEFGFGRAPNGLDLDNPYCENFDVLAHELGHSIIFSIVGFPDSDAAITDEYGGFHESAGDLTSLVASLHFEKVIGALLDATHGNLFTRNELERVGELRDSREIRRAFNSLRLEDVNAEPHDLSQPLTGALFDVFVEVFQKRLVERNLISKELADRSYNEANSAHDDGAVQAGFDAAYAGNASGFADALREARDYWGRLLAVAWSSLDANFLTYAKIAAATLEADRQLAGGANLDTIRGSFAWRHISTRNRPFATSVHRCTQDSPSLTAAPAPRASRHNGKPASKEGLALAAASLVHG